MVALIRYKETNLFTTSLKVENRVKVGPSKAKARVSEAVCLNKLTQLGSFRHNLSHREPTTEAICKGQERKDLVIVIVESN